ncbi:HET-domain-containing protein [Cadophora sp. DSE1049]|nr:HET-domain-containing protein [Cadophora sp. DSE1049]
MRLLHAKTFKLHSFFGQNIPSYAILSHRWGATEVVFQDLESENGVEIAQANVKIAGCCEQAERDEYEYVWIDSCCIDKSSSAELSEAINSMFRWYKDAIICYVYMSDVSFAPSYPAANRKAFRKSDWFTRGWTLQELLAPDMMVFYDHAWKEIGTKATLESEIKAVTKITHLFDFSKACIAQKMSWASKRETTRAEDEAYCLMGLFGVNLPILYGEVANAFLRLQQEIIKQSDDESIFAWKSAVYLYSSGMLATNSADFGHAGEITRLELKGTPVFPFEMTNKGLRIRLQLTPATPSRSKTSEPEIDSHRLFPEFEAPDESTRVVYVTTPQRSRSIEWSLPPACWFHVIAKGWGSRWLHGYQIKGSMDERLLSQRLPLKIKSQEGVIRAIFWKDESRVFLGMTFKDGWPGVQMHLVVDLDSQRALPQPLTGPPMDRASISLSAGLDVFAALRKVTDRSREGLPQYRVSLTVAKSNSKAS